MSSLTLISLVLAILKLCGVIAVSWLVVFAPFILLVVIQLVVLGVLLRAAAA